MPNDSEAPKEQRRKTVALSSIQKFWGGASATDDQKQKEW